MDTLSTMIDCENCCSWTIASHEYKRLQNVETEDEICKPRVTLLCGKSGSEEVVAAYENKIIWSRYLSGQSNDIPSDFKTFSFPTSFDFILWTNFEFDQRAKAHDCSLVVIKDCHLSSFSFSGEYLQCKLSVEAKSVWSTRSNGLIVESKDLSSSNKSYSSLSSLYNLTHPCDELAPVICCNKSAADPDSVGHLTEFTAATKSSVVASLTSLDVLVTHDTRKGHSFWIVRKASEVEKEAFYHQREVQFNEANASKVKLTGDAMKTPRFEKIQNCSPIPRASITSQRLKMNDSPMSDVQSPLFMQSMRLTTTRKYVPHSSPFAPKGGAFDPRSFTKFGDTTMLGMPWLEMPLTPNLCLQFITSDEDILKKHMPRFAASKVFESRDLLGRSYICLQIRQMETLFLYQLKKDQSGNQITSLEKAGFIQCEDSINVEDLPYMAILEKDSSLTLYSGLHKMCKVRRWHTSPNLALPTYPVQIQTSLDETIKDFKVSIGRKVIANTFGSAKLIYITLPGLSENPVVEMFLDSLKMYLDQEKYIAFVCEWFAVRNAVGKEVDKKIELDSFLQFLLGQIGLVFNQETQENIDCENCASTSAGIEPMDDESDSKTKKVRMNESGTRSDFSTMLASASVSETLDLIGDFGFQSEKPISLCKTSCGCANFHYCTKSTFNADAPLCQHFELILKMSHIIYEESKLDIVKEASSFLLAKFMLQIAHALGMHKLKMQYLIDYPVLSSPSFINDNPTQLKTGILEQDEEISAGRKRETQNCLPDVLADSDRLSILKFFPSLANSSNLSPNCLSNYTAPSFVKWAGDLIRNRKSETSPSSDDYCDSYHDLFTLRGDKSSKLYTGSCLPNNLYEGKEKTSGGNAGKMVATTAEGNEYGKSFTPLKGGVDDFPCNPFPCIWGVTERIIKTAIVLFYILSTEKSTRNSSASISVSTNTSVSKPSEDEEKNDSGAAMETKAKGDNAFCIKIATTRLSHQNFISSEITAAPLLTCAGGPEEPMHTEDANHVENAATEAAQEGTSKDFTFTDLLRRCVNGLQNYEKQDDCRSSNAYFSPLPLFRQGKDVASAVPPETAKWILNVENIFMSKYQRGASRSENSASSSVGESSRQCGAGKTLWNYAKGKADSNNADQNNFYGNKNNGKTCGVPVSTCWSSSAGKGNKESEEKLQLERLRCGKEFDLLGHVLLFITEIGIDSDFVDTLPLGVSLPILNVIYEGHLSPLFNWPAKVINLVRRRDLLKRKDVIFGDRLGSTQEKEETAMVQKDNQRKTPCVQQKLGTQKQYILMEQYQLNHHFLSTGPTTDSTAQAVSNNFRAPNVSSAGSTQQIAISWTPLETSGLEFDEEVLNVLFACDCRIQSVKRMLNSSQPVKMKAQPQQTDLQSKLARYAKRTMALPVGRGMFTLSSVAPTLTSTEPIPVLNFAARVLPKNIIVNLNSATLSSNSRQWVHYHNGVAAGLRIDQNSTEVDTAWVIYNRPKTSAAMDYICTHTGFLLGLALNGHLDNMSAYNLHSYLCRNHEMTNISLLLGLSASKQGSRDGMLTKTLTLHVNALLPSGGTELDVGCNVQITALLSVGFLFMGSADRHMAEVMLSQINRPPGPEMENCVNRESYSLTAGLSLGMILLGKGHNMFGGMKTGLTFTTQLYSYIKGGANPHAFSQNNCYQIQEGENINLCMTSPGATLATGLIFFNTCSYAISDWFKPPETALTIDTVLPEHLMLHVIAKGLICWQEIVPYKEWVQSNLPRFLLPLLENFKSPISGFINLAGFDVSSYQAFCNLIAGSCLALGLRFAGMQNKSAFNLMLKYVKVFLHLLDYEQTQSSANGATSQDYLDASNPGFKTILNCLHSCLIAVCMVMAGTGNLQILSIIRYLHCKVANNFGYGHHMAVHMALGLLCLGRCQHTLRNDAGSVAALLASLYPVYPLTSVDNRYHLQAFRHLYVKAAEPRLLVTRNITTKHVERVPVRIGLKASLNYDNYIYQTQTPCLIPQLDLVSAIEILSNSSFQENSAWSYLHSENGVLRNYNTTPAVCNPIKNVADIFGRQFQPPQSVACTASSKRNKTRSFLPLRIDFDQKTNIEQFSLLLKTCLFVQPYSATAIQQQQSSRMLSERSNPRYPCVDFSHFPSIWASHSTVACSSTVLENNNESEMSFACGLIDAFQFTATQFADCLGKYRSLGSVVVSSSRPDFNKRGLQILMKALPVNSNLFLQQLNLVNCFVNSSSFGNLILPQNAPWLKYVHAKLLSNLMGSLELSKHSLLCLLNNRFLELLNSLSSGSQNRNQLHCLTQFICFTGLEVFLQDSNYRKPACRTGDTGSNPTTGETGTFAMDCDIDTNKCFDSFWTIPRTENLDSALTKNETAEKLTQMSETSRCGEKAVILKNLKPDLLNSADYYSFFLHKL